MTNQPTPDTGKPTPFPALRQPVIYFGLSMVALMWLGVGLQIHIEKSAAVRQNMREAATLARAFEESVVRAIGGVDSTLQFARNRVMKTPSEGQWHEFLQEVAPDNQLIIQMAFIDAQGYMVSSTKDLHPAKPVDLRDREHFSVHLDRSRDELFISRPVVGRVSGKASIQLSRKLSRPDGSFAGVVVASVDPQHFTDLYRSIDLGSGGGVVIVGLDGLVRVGTGIMTAGAGDYHGKSILFERSRSAAVGDYLDSSGPQKTMVSYRLFQRFPLIVAVAMSPDFGAEALFVARPYYLGGVGVLTLLVVLAVALKVRHGRRLHLARVALAGSERRFREKSRELELTLEHMGQGIMMIDSCGRIPVMNRQAARLLDLEENIGQRRPTYRDLVCQMQANGEFDDASATKDGQIVDYLINSDTQPIVPAFQHQRPNGAILEVKNSALPDGGFVRTLTDVTMQRRAEEQVLHLAKHDTLTNLSNRFIFREELAAALGAISHGPEFALLVLDLDRFKMVNDTLGHPIGDKLLRLVATRLRNCVRQGDVVARMGGDEFAIIQVGAGSHWEAHTLAERLRDTISQPYEIDGQRVLIGTSIGIALAPRDGSNSDELLKAADLALYSAKSAGRSAFHFFEEEMSHNVKARRQLEADLRVAMDNRELEVRFQPILDLRTGSIRGFEALLRWRHPERGLVSPGEFIAVAEELGLIVPIGAWALATACAEAMKWPSDISVAVNLSPIQLSNSDIVATMRTTLQTSGLAPERLELEITESTLLQSDKITRQRLEELKSMGIRFAMDDFGTGYSSLSYLRSFAFDKIKIDRSFVSELVHNSDCAAIVRTITDLASRLGIDTTAEGIETKEQLEHLLRLGCTEGQGYLFSRACRAQDALEMVRDRHLVAA